MNWIEVYNASPQKIADRINSLESIVIGDTQLIASLERQLAEARVRIGGVMVNEHIERLQATTADDGDTWDLSDNDKAAISYALRQLAEARKQAFRDAETVIERICLTETQSEREIALCALIEEALRREAEK